MKSHGKKISIKYRTYRERTRIAITRGFLRATVRSRGAKRSQGSARCVKTFRRFAPDGGSWRELASSRRKSPLPSDRARARGAINKTLNDRSGTPTRSRRYRVTDKIERIRPGALMSAIERSLSLKERRDLLRCATSAGITDGFSVRRSASTNLAL